jgi:GNAT superfamily N-acetyltransferase
MTSTNPSSPPLSTAITIREATLKDAGGIARVKVDTWRDAYPGIVADDYLARMSYGEQADFFKSIIEQKSEERLIVAETREGEIVGFIGAGPERAGNPRYRGEIYALYVRPEYQGRGIGTRLFFDVAAGLTRRGMLPFLLWVFPENPATAFYARMGGTPIVTQQFELGGKQMNETAYAWDDVSALMTDDL